MQSVVFFTLYVKNNMFGLYIGNSVLFPFLETEESRMRTSEIDRLGAALGRDGGDSQALSLSYGPAGPCFGQEDSTSCTIAMCVASAVRHLVFLKINFIQVCFC